MSTITLLQPTFAGGEYSPAIYPRVDIQKYSSGLRRCRNFLIHPEGGASNRPGWKYVASQKYSDKMAIVVPFIFSRDQAYVLEFGHQYIRFYTDQAQIAVSSVTAWSGATAYTVGDLASRSGVNYYCIAAHTNQQPPNATYWYALTGSIYEIPSPYSESDLRDLKFERSADVMYILHPDYQTRTLTRYGNTDWVIDLYAPTDGPFMPENILDSLSLAASAVTGSITLSATSAVFNSLHVGALFKLRHYVEGQAVSTAFTSATTSSSIKCFTTWRIITHGTWTGKFKIEKSTDGGTTWTVLRVFASANDFNANTSGTEDPETNTEPFLIRINFYSYTSGTANIDLTTDPFYQEGIVKVTSYTSNISVNATVLQAIASTAQTTSWSEGSWSNYRGWPRVGVFHQDRLVFASTDAEPMTIWMSRTGVYTSFGRNSTLLDTDSISVNLLSRQLNAVNGLVSLGDIVAFTSGSEWRVSASSDVFTPTNIFAKIQGYRGSSGVIPIVIGNRIIYMQANGNVPRDFAFRFESDSFDGSDLAVLFRHRFSGYTILEMAYQQDPDSIVWMVRDDGVLLALTYMQEQEVAAWSWHDTDGDVESVCVVPGDGFDEVWLAVKRGSSRFIERMSQRMASTDAQDQFFVDCGISHDSPVSITAASQANPIVISAAGHGFSNGNLVDISDVAGMTQLNGNRYKVASATANTFALTDEHTGANVNGTSYGAYTSGGKARKCFTTFSGLTHLNGRTVAILGNGEVYPQQTVSSGQITLSRACSRVHVGLPYKSDLETLNIEVPLRGGTIQGKPVKIGMVTFRVINSRGGYIGPNEDTIYEAFLPVRTALGHPPELFSRDVRETLGAGYEDGGRIFFRQSDPLPVTISAIIPEVSFVAQ